MTLLEDVREARENYQDYQAQLRRIRKRIEKSEAGTKRRLELRDKQERTKEALERAERIKKRLVKRLKNRRAEDKKLIESTAPGTPHWGGCRYIIDEIVIPELVEDHVAITSRKRTETYGNPTSDHHVSQTTADAVDGAIANAFTLADEIGGELGVGDVADYVTEEFSIEGHRFRVQLIAATHGTGPHLHVGLRRI